MTSPELSLLHQSLQLHPFGEAIDPMIDRQAVFAHAKPVAAFRVHVQLYRLVSCLPLLIESNTVRGQAEIVIAGCGDEHRRRIFRYRRVPESSNCRVNGSDEGWTAF